ncbi:MAG: acylphosphatase [Candidatus Margulisbacteria bacterium]|nr:acylphosphatase [Candidatus Margulisiibacteriota bacterium]
MCLHAIVKGIVQGVCYRISTQEKALDLGVKGWVCNTQEGTVEILMAGATQDVKNMEAWLWKGPPSAVVESVEIESLPYNDDLNTFEIR